MNTAVLMQKLLEIERMIGIEAPSEIRERVLDAQECLLQLQRRSLETRRRNESSGQGQFSFLHQFAREE